MGSSRREPGFTLIEAMIVTIIIGIVSVLAVVAYRKWLQTSYLAEAQDMVSNIRSAEDAFYSENGVTYLPVSTGLGPGFDYPAATPGAFKTGWGAACGAQCASSTAWKQLAVQPSGAVAYGYSVETDGTAGSVYTTSPPTYATPLAGIKVNGTAVDLSGMAGRPWYIIEADGDFFGRGTFTSVFAFSGNNQLFISNGTQ